MSSFPGPRFSLPEFCPTSHLLLREPPAQADRSDQWREHIYRNLHHQVFRNNFCFPLSTPGTAFGEDLNDFATASSFCDCLSMLRHLIHETSFLTVPTSCFPWLYYFLYKHWSKNFVNEFSWPWGVETGEGTLSMSLGVGITRSAAVREGNT